MVTRMRLHITLYVQYFLPLSKDNFPVWVHRDHDVFSQRPHYLRPLIVHQINVRCPYHLLQILATRYFVHVWSNAVVGQATVMVL